LPHSIEYGVIGDDLYQLHLATFIVRRIQLARRTNRIDALRIKLLADEEQACAEADVLPDDDEKITRILERLNEEGEIICDEVNQEC
jgi:hypothetical protein